MQRTQLNKEVLLQAIHAGCRSIIQQKSLLNQINIFPVADNDTGDNMAATADAIIQFSSVQETLKATLESIANGSIIGARGNSGLIFSQFFNAFYKFCPDQETLNLEEFSGILFQVAAKVRESIAEPVEGTLLTMMESWAHQVREWLGLLYFEETMMHLLPFLEQELKQTTDVLPSLKEADVVDAGALGFYYFVTGFSYFIKNPNKVLLPKSSDLKVTIEHTAACATTAPDHRYCTEAVLKADHIDTQHLLKFLEAEGDCALVTSNEHLGHFHVHTNCPQHVFSSMLKDYTIQYPKVDDMLRQFETQYQRKHTVALLTDSGADLPQELLDKHQIHQISLNIQLDDHQLLDRYSFMPEELYERISQAKVYPKTSCPTPAIIETKMALLSSHYDHVIAIPMSKVMSGTFEAFNTAAQSYPNVHVIDSKNNSGAHGLILNYAGELIAAETPLDILLSSIHQAIENTYLFVIVNQFDSLIRSGRIPKFAGQLAKIAGLKPIISIDHQGKGYIYDKSFSIQSAFQKLINPIQNKMKELSMVLKEYCIIHANSQEKAQEFAALTTEAFDMPPAFIEPASLAVGLHAGEGCIAIAARLST